MEISNSAKRHSVITSPIQKLSIIAQKVGIRFGKSLVFLIAILFGIPVIMLPFTTSVPALIWILLMLADFALFIVYFRVKPVWVGIMALLGGTFGICLIAIWASQFFATTPPIQDDQGRLIPGSIASLEKVSLNGSDQWISIRGENDEKPVLLFLAGGPGGSQLATARHSIGALEKYFVVVNWEQPGAGKSYNAVDQASLTPERYVEDGIALTNYLIQRFDQEKIYVMGESWGSVLGIWMVQQEPELFHAFIGTGQMIAFLDTDLHCYQFALQLAQERGDEKKVAQLATQGPPPYYGEGVAMKQAAYLLDTFAYMNENPAISNNGFNTLRDLASPEYGLIDKVNWARGPLVTLGYVYPYLWDVDFRIQATKLEVPVYFLIGRHDVNAPPALTEEYFDLLEAPQKKLIWFEKSGHNPWVNEPATFVDATVETILLETKP